MKNFKKHMVGQRLAKDKLMGALLPLTREHGGPILEKAKMKA